MIGSIYEDIDFVHNNQIISGLVYTFLVILDKSLFIFLSSCSTNQLFKPWFVLREKELDYNV